MLDRRRQRERFQAEEAALEERREELERRGKELDSRGQELDRRAGELDAREASLREGEAGESARREEHESRARRIASDRAELDAYRADLEARERHLAEDRLELESKLRAERAVIAEREAAAAASERSVAEREREVEEARGRIETAERRWDQLMALPPGQSAPPDVRPELEATAGRWSLSALEDLVEQRALEFPERAQEWRTYLFYLRPYAARGGYIPRAFEAMVYEVFADLIGTES